MNCVFLLVSGAEGLVIEGYEVRAIHPHPRGRERILVQTAHARESALIGGFPLDIWGYHVVFESTVGTTSATSNAASSGAPLPNPITPWTRYAKDQPPRQRSG
jgi:hypothetical protein